MSRRISKNAKFEDEFSFQCRAYKLPTHVRQFRFAKSLKRRWQFDFAFEEYNVAVEIEGLVVKRINGELVCTGRHASITGFREDCVKYASAAMLGWTVIRFEQSQVKAGDAIGFTQKVLYAKGWRKSGRDEIAHVG